MDEPNREEVIESVRRFAGEQNLKQFIVNLQLVAELYPEEVRAALATAFDAQAAEDRLAQIGLVCNHAELKLAGLAELTGWLDVHAGPTLEAAVRMDERVDALEKHTKRAFDYLRQVVNQLQAAKLLKPPEKVSTNGRK